MGGGGATFYTNKKEEEEDRVSLFWSEGTGVEGAQRYTAAKYGMEKTTTLWGMGGAAGPAGKRE